MSARLPANVRTSESVAVTPGCSRTSSEWANAVSRADASRRGASGIQKTPSGKPSDASAAACSASRVFPEPPGPGERHEPRVLTGEQLDDLSELSLAPEERRHRNRQIRPVEALERRELAFAELIHALRRAEILEAVLAEVDQLDLDESRCRSRDEHLPAVACGRDPSGAVHVVADVALVADDRGSRVERRRARGSVHWRRGCSVSSDAAARAPGAVGKAKKNASPCVSTSTPPFPAHASRISLRCSASASAYASAPELVQQ